MRPPSKDTEIRALARKRSSAVSSPRRSTILSISNCNRYPYSLLSFSRARPRVTRSLPAGGKRKGKARRNDTVAIAALADFSRRKTRVFSLSCACRTRRAISRGSLTKDAVGVL